MNRADFLGPATMIVAAGIPPMGTVFNAVPPVTRRPPTEPRPGPAGAPDRAAAARPVPGKAGPALTAPHLDPDCRA